MSIFGQIVWYYLILVQKAIYFLKINGKILPKFIMQAQICQFILLWSEIYDFARNLDKKENIDRKNIMNFIKSILNTW